MLAKCFTASALVLSIFLLSIQAQAITASTAVTELESFKAQLAKSQAELALVTTALKAVDAKFQQAANTPSPEKDKYEQAKAAVIELTALAAKDPSKASELNNEQFKLTLAERKYKRSNQELQQLDDEKEALEQKITTHTALIRELESKIPSHEALIIELQANEIANEKQRLAKQQQEMARLKAENERLQALKLAEDQAAAEAAVLAAQEAAEAEAAAAALAAAELAAMIPDRSKRDTVTFLKGPKKIKGEEQRQLQLAAEGDGSQIGTSKTLTIRIPEQLTRSITLSAVGGNQYRGESKVAFGVASFFIDQQVWIATIPEALNNQQVTFLLDLSDLAKPYLVFFKSQ